VSAVEQISGRGSELLAIQVRDLCGEDIQKLLNDRMRDTGIRVIFTDLQAGSCTMAARRVLRDLGEGVLVAGANLPMLLDFVFSENPSATASAETAAERGRVAVTVHKAPA
ncbi:MAG: hypothetical protein ABIY52_07370, partial [Gemmatimonadaceae bacterium]